MTAGSATSRQRVRGWRGLFGRFRRDRRGVYAVEFGLLALPFFGLIFGIVEIGWVNYNAEGLQAAVDKAARKVMTGQAQTTGYPNAAAFTAGLLCPTDGSRILPASFDCSKLVVDIRTATDFASISTNTSSSFYTGQLSYCLGNPATIVVLRVDYPLDTFFPLSIYNQYVGLANNFPGVSGWKHIIMGSAVFKTEPYTGSSPTCS